MIPDHLDVKDPLSMGQRCKWGLYTGVAIGVGMPFVALGILFCLTIIGTPIGFLLFGLSGIPLAMVQKRRAKQIANYSALLNPNEEVPWEE